MDKPELKQIEDAIHSIVPAVEYASSFFNL